MNADLLKVKWKQISSSEIMQGYKSIRITSDCIADIYLGINENGDHSLILSLPEEHKVEFKSVEKEKITIEYFPDKNYLIMTLRDKEFNNLFDDLIVSLFNAIKDVNEIEKYSKVFIQTFYQWVLFFTLDYKLRLKKDIIKGIWGELFALKEIIESGGDNDIDDILSGWVGPYDQGHDFIYDDVNIEIKTKDIKKVSIRLSSEYQLEVEAGKKLTLAVVSIEDDLINGFSLKDLVLQLKEIIFERLGDFTLVLKALLQKGITLHNIQEYNNYRFKPLSTHQYDCLAEGFPKITSLNIPSCINNVKYDLNLTNLTEYIISVREY